MPVFFPSPLSYVLVLALCLANAVWVLVSEVRFHADQLAVTGLLLAGAAPTSFLLRGRFPFDGDAASRALARLVVVLQGTIFLLLAWFALRVFNHLSMTTSFAYADRVLSRWDEWLGLDWLTYFHFVERNDFLRTVLDHGYKSLTPVSVIAYLVLSAQHDLRRAAFFLETFVIVAVVCTTIGMFFPAEAAVATHLGASADFGAFGEPPGLYHLPHMERLRGEGVIVLDLRDLPGLVTFPSFHTAAGIVLAWSFRGSVLFWPAAGYSAAMIGSTPVFGAHYYVDLVAGAAIACAILATFSRLPAYAHLFGPRGGTGSGPRAYAPNAKYR
ncbi:MAG: phosphatase PAP2 family protein [Burkholderiaceae bacterium]|nr:phosphatase PAP2 family protein [Burkholderiaceae bacterium]